jgi:hypothetical protein
MVSMARLPETVKTQGIPPAVPPSISLLPLSPLPRRHRLRISPQALQPSIASSPPIYAAPSSREAAVSLHALTFSLPPTSARELSLPAPSAARSLVHLRRREARSASCCRGGPWAPHAHQDRHKSVRGERAVDGRGTCGDALKRKARSLSEPSLLLQIPPWSHCMHTEASVPAQGFHSGF